MADEITAAKKKTDEEPENKSTENTKNITTKEINEAIEGIKAVICFLADSKDREAAYYFANRLCPAGNVLEKLLGEGCEED